MICQNCQFLNTQNSTNCVNCDAPLSKQPKASVTNPFGDFKPAWMQASPSLSPNYQSNQSAEVDADDFIAQLLDTATPPQQARGFGSPPIATLPRKPLTSTSSSPAATATPHYKVPGIGFYKGCYIFPDEYGGTQVRPLASLPTRLVAAGIDGFVTYWINYAFFFVFVLLLFGRLNVHTTPLQQFFEHAISGNTSKDNPVADAAVASLILAFIGGAIPALYHTGLVTWGGRTLGHRLCGIQVIRSNGKGVGLISALVRALWGIGYSFTSGFIIGFVLGLTAQYITYSDIGSFSVLSDQPTSPGNLIFFAGLCFSGFIVLMVMLTNPGRRGMHDMLADTYVVTNKTLTQLELD